jgi:lipopolysaccharide/colanic/teichoic acid biosynthesis glycosyltransferase
MRRTQGRVAYDDSSVIAESGFISPGGARPAYWEFPELSPLNTWQYRYAKRAFDLVFASLMFIVFLIPGLVIAALIRLTSRHPIFYREERIGRHGVPFRIWKFRSMRPHGTVKHPSVAHSEGTVLRWRIQKHKNDPRITPVGRFLRRWSLDELPQLFNVLRGEMSLIGPRPVVKAETYLYKHLLPYYLAATPGLSGLWQVSGRSDLDYDDRARLDATYVQSWSFRSDLSILFRTIPAVLCRVGAR